MTILLLTMPDDNITSVAAPTSKKASLLQTARIVVSMLFMIGRNRDYGPSAPAIDPLRLALVVLVGAVLVIGGLVALATYVAG